MKDPRQITPAEFQIMEALWRGEGALSVRDVLQVVRRDRKVAYTTIMTLLGKLADKGSVTRSRRGKAYIYRPAVGRAEALEYLVREFVDAYCGGDRTRLGALVADAGPAPPPRRVRSRSAPPKPKSDKPRPEAPELDVALL